MKIFKTILAMGALLLASASVQAASWDETVAAAKKEGKVVITGPTLPTWRGPLLAFEKEFGIKVEFTGAWGRDFYPRFAQERKAGKQLWDLRVTAAEARTYRLLAQGGVIASLRDILVLPEVVGDKYWHGGFDAVFADKEKKYFFGFGMNAQPLAYVNRALVTEAELSHVRQLADPKWRGKISSADPRAGAAMVGLSILLVSDGFGEKFMRSIILGNKAVITRNPRLQVDWLVRGKYPIAIAPSIAIVHGYQKRGMKAAGNIKPLAGPPAYSSLFGGLIALKNPPHPNAAKVYANWVLTRAVQQAIANSAIYNSRRTDVTPGNPLAVMTKKKLKGARNLQTEDMLPHYQTVLKMGRELGSGKKRR